MPMEDSREDLVSYREMSGDEDFLHESPMMSFDEEELFLRDIIANESDTNHFSSSSLQSLDRRNQSVSPNKGYVLSFDHNPVVMSSESRTRSHCNEPRVQQRTKRVRKTECHILAERNRRLELTKGIIALSATIPGLKRNDKAYVLHEAVNYMKQLQERVKELENEKTKKRVVESTILIKKTRLSINNNDSRETHYGCVEELPEVEATVLDKDVLIEIHCEKRMPTLHKLICMLNNLHLSITGSSILPFGTSTVKITIIAQMNDEYNMTIDDLVKTLRQRLLCLKSQYMESDSCW
ncbi:hypothetical protein RJT34_18135 [Clitoria ternatea]|uniref:BHLH domain-containing protein n=1 Tax=Clitoria ternatea TaxID=43366 RepID=A0AAN9JA79_CLITE